MHPTEPSQEVIDWYRARKEQLASNKGNNRTYYWNFCRDLKIQFIRLLCEQFGIPEPNFEWNARRVAAVDTTRRGAYVDGTIYCSAKATHGRHMLNVFFQYKCSRVNLTKENYPELFPHAESFASEYWKRLSQAVKN